MGAVVEVDAADRGRDHLEQRAFSAANGRRQCLAHPGRRAVGDEHADLAAGERVGSARAGCSAPATAASRSGAAAGFEAAGSVGHAEPVGDPLGEVLVDVAQVGDHALADVGPLDLAELEDERVGDVLLLDRRLAARRTGRAWL